MLDALVRKYSALALEAKSIREARAAFDIAERAHKMMIAERTSQEKQAKFKKAPKNLTAVFISNIVEKTDRAELFRAYVDYCSSQNFEPDRKSDFFAKLAIYGFKLSRSGSIGYYFSPPRTMSARLKSDAEI